MTVTWVQATASVPAGLAVIRWWDDLLPDFYCDGCKLYVSDEPERYGEFYRCIVCANEGC